MEDFQDVFSNEQDHLKIMKGKPMNILLEPDAKPSAITAARAIPYAWREEVR